MSVYYMVKVAFIESFLADCTMQVELVPLCLTEKGVPQGGVLSTTLFYIKIIYIVKC